MCKHYLGEIRRARIKAEQIEEELRMLRLECTGSAIQYDKLNVQTTATADPMLEYMIRVETLETKLKQSLTNLYESRRRIIEQIHSLDDERFMMVLFKRYVEEKSFEQIAVEMSYDYKWTCRLHGMALNEFNNKILNNTNKHE